MASTQDRLALIRFGVFDADLQAGELRRNGVKVRLQDLPFRALTLLVSRPGEVITREEFRQAMWPADVFVDFDQGISTAVMRLRTALKDSADKPIFIETVGRRGYRWIAPIHAPEPVDEIPSEDPARGEAHTSVLSRIKLIYLIPVVTLLCVAWVMLSGLHATRANTRADAPSAHVHHEPANQEAENFYLRGRFYWNKRTAESLNQAVDAFTQAIVHDPNYADAYVGLADSYNLLREFSAMPPNDAYSRGMAAAKKAVELDPGSSEAHAALAFDLYWGQWDAPRAEEEFRRAIELDPANAKAHHWFATYLSNVGRFSEALQQIEIARKLDPTSSAIMADQGELLRVFGRRDEAIQLLRQVEKADPNFASPHRYLWVAYLYSSDYPDFIAELKEDARLTHNSTVAAEAEAAARGYAHGGDRGMFQAMLPVQKQLYQQGKLSPYFVANSAMHLGNKKEALDYIRLTVKSRDAFAMGIRQDPVFASLRNDSEYEQLCSELASKLEN